MQMLRKLLGITKQELDVLIWIYENNPTNWTLPSDIQQHFGIRLVRANQILKKLFDKELVERERFLGNDRRVRYKYIPVFKKLDDVIDWRFSLLRERLDTERSRP